jgi:hypothetical protein
MLLCKTCYLYVYVNLHYVAFIGLTQRRSLAPSKYFANTYLEVSRVPVLGTLTIYLHTKFHI